MKFETNECKGMELEWGVTDDNKAELARHFEPEEQYEFQFNWTDLRVIDGTVPIFNGVTAQDYRECQPSQ